jgi:hypothetical protein
MSEWIEFGQPWSMLPGPEGDEDGNISDAEWLAHAELEEATTFIGRRLAKPGIEVEVKHDKGLHRYLIGDINKVGGVCDDCMAFEPSDIVTRYRVLIEQEG